MEKLFTPREDSSYLFGLGVLDDKGPFAAALAALKRLKGKKLDFCFQVMGICDEEYGLIGIRYMIPSEVIIGESTGMKIIRSHKGSNRFTFRTRGKTVHSSLVPQGENAIYKAAKIVTALEKYSDQMLREPGHPLLGTNTLSVGVIKGGTQPSFVPDECTFIVNFRSLPAETKERISNRLEEAADAANVDYEIISRSFDADGLDTPENVPLIHKIQTMLARFGFDPVPQGLPYARNLSAQPNSGFPQSFGVRERWKPHILSENSSKKICYSLFVCILLCVVYGLFFIWLCVIYTLSNNPFFRLRKRLGIS